MVLHLGRVDGVDAGQEPALGRQDEYCRRRPSQQVVQVCGGDVANPPEALSGSSKVTAAW